MENNLAETAFVCQMNGNNCYFNYVPDSNTEAHFKIRYYTPACEIALCGHATLASAHVLYGDSNLVASNKTIVFHTHSEEILTVKKNLTNCEYEMNCWPKKKLPNPFTML